MIDITGDLATDLRNAYLDGYIDGFREAENRLELVGTLGAASEEWKTSLTFHALDRYTKAEGGERASEEKHGS